MCHHVCSTRHDMCHHVCSTCVLSPPPELHLVRTCDTWGTGRTGVEVDGRMDDAVLDRHHRGDEFDAAGSAETLAVKKVFGDHARKLAISSTKSMLGHLLGASGGVELIAAVLSIKHGVVHPTINLDTPDPACDLDYVPNVARKMPVRYALSNSFGFGGRDTILSLVVGALR